MVCPFCAMFISAWAQSEQVTKRLNTPLPSPYTHTLPNAHQGKRKTPKKLLLFKFLLEQVNFKTSFKGRERRDVTMCILSHSSKHKAACCCLHSCPCSACVFYCHQVCSACRTLCLMTKPKSNRFPPVTWRCTTLTSKGERP